MKVVKVAGNPSKFEVVAAGKPLVAMPVGMKKTTKVKRRSRSLRSGLAFPVGRIHRYLKVHIGGRRRVGTAASVYTAGVLEYLVAEVMELAGNSTKRGPNRRKRITARDILLTLKGDQELEEICKRVVIPGGGVIPHIHKILLPENEGVARVGLEAVA